MDANIIHIKKFSDIDVSNSFFDTLKTDYSEFEAWFKKKADNTAFTFSTADGTGIDGFLYLKEEQGPVDDVTPPLPADFRLKVGTFKINPHGTRLGERFLKRAFDTAVACGARALYVTVFAKHDGLIQLFQKYGFVEVAKKKSTNGEELVLERRLDTFVGDIVKDYPRIPIDGTKHHILSIYPKFHSRLLPDSLLKTEAPSILDDVSHTNSIHKIYLTSMKVGDVKPGDTLLIYRTNDGGGSAEYRSVVTSLCVVEHFRHISTFGSVEQFLEFCAPYSVFDETELRGFYKSKKHPWLIQFTYNIALKKRINRKALADDAGLSRDMYWGFFSINRPTLKRILQLSGDYEKARTLVYPP